MRRRSAIATLFATGRWARAQFGATPEDAHGAAVVVDVSTGRVISQHSPDLAQRMLAPPGSTLKPIVLGTLLEAGKLRPAEQWKCTAKCTHATILAPMNLRTALAYSCNNFVAHMAARFGQDELPVALARYGLDVQPGTDVRLLALGEEGVLVTASMLAGIYRRLALRCGRAALAPILAGMEDAVEYGTAQQAKIPNVKVAGKTGSVLAADGAHIAWFAGFAPSRQPKVAIAVMVQGRSGGADAAPIAARILRSRF